jgi:hypothetical protein
MHVVTLLDAARSHARLSGAPVILLQVSIHDGEAISRLPDVIPATVRSDLFDGPQILGFGTAAQAVMVFNDIVRMLVSTRFECAYEVTLVDGEADPVVESNVDRRRTVEWNRHACARIGANGIECLALSTAEYEAMPPSPPIPYS